LTAATLTARGPPLYIAAVPTAVGG